MTISWRETKSRPFNGQPALRVIEGGRDQIMHEILRLVEQLREVERHLVSAREELHRLRWALGKEKDSWTNQARN